MKKLRIFIVIGIVAAFIWFLVVSPMMTFHENEKMLENAARRYYELNENELPTGERVKTLSLSTLYHKSFLEKDIYVPYSKKVCSIENSWVKVKRENNDFHYYVYLDCGTLKSNIDHEGPVITLEGDESVNVNIGGTFKDPGVRSVIDKKEGTIKASELIVESDNIDTSKIGTYDVKYIAYDSMLNKTVVTRKVNVVQELYGTIKNVLGENTNFVGKPDNNYIYFSNMLFRIYGVTSDNNVVLISERDIANVNYSKLEDWLDYFYDNLNDNSKQMIVGSRYCNMEVDDTTVYSKECTSYTNEKKVYIPSVVEVNNAKDANGYNFIVPSTISWISNMKDKKNAYTVGLMLHIYYNDLDYKTSGITDNYGVRPMLTIDGKSLIKNGDGSKKNPYYLGDVEYAKTGTELNERNTGEFISIGGSIYRIVETLKDGTTRVLSETTLLNNQGEDVVTTANAKSEKIAYNPKDKKSVGYYINNKAVKFVDTSYFVSHEFEVPVYNKDIIYKEENSIRKYKALLSAPNMFEMFAAQSSIPGDCNSYWLVNTSNKKRITGAVDDFGIPINTKLAANKGLGIRIAAYVKKGTVITSGKGTLNSPYIIK